tara:strand:- start:3560 stop:4252 length:693 start_codon:yes stop_codon:yes gene_type:complete
MIIKNKNYLFLLMFFTVLFGQVKNNRSLFPSDKYVLGGFINASDLGLDFEFLANVDTRYGLYGNIWFNQIDYYSDTDIQSNTSIGYNKKFIGGFLLDFGYSYNYSFADRPEQLSEIYLGAGLENISIYTYISDNDFSFESWYKPNIDVLNKSSLDCLFYGYLEQNGYDVSINISNQLSDNLIAGIMLGYEHYNENDSITYEKNNQKKTYKITNTYSGISSMIYFGFLINN